MMLMRYLILPVTWLLVVVILCITALHPELWIFALISIVAGVAQYHLSKMDDPSKPKSNDDLDAAMDDLPVAWQRIPLAPVNQAILLHGATINGGYAVGKVTYTTNGKRVITDHNGNVISENTHGQQWRVLQIWSGGRPGDTIRWKPIPV